MLVNPPATGVDLDVAGVARGVHLVGTHDEVVDPVAGDVADRDCRAEEVVRGVAGEQHVRKAGGGREVLVARDVRAAEEDVHGAGAEDVALGADGEVGDTVVVDVTHCGDAEAVA